MVFAHIPSGYLLAKLTGPRRDAKPYFWAACLGSVFPDLDLAYYTFSVPHEYHHECFMHLPFFWFFFGALVFSFRRRLQNHFGTLCAFLGAVWLHLILDSFTGGIMWGYPFSEQRFALFALHPTHSFWLWNEVLSWTFGFELLILGWAAVLYLNENSRPQSTYQTEVRGVFQAENPTFGRIA